MRAVLAAAFFLILAAPAGAWIPNDPGTSGTPGGWQADQWNLLPGTGIDAPRAWDNLIAVGRPGGRGVRIAVVDSGVAYRRSPDLSSIRFERGYDFCAHTGRGDYACSGEDNQPIDTYGHGTHVASTIAESTNNGIGLTGIAYGATIIPVKVLNKKGEGDEGVIAKGLRYAADQRAQIINVSFEFGSGLTSAAEVPRIAAAVRYAQRKGALVIAAAGNDRVDALSYPAALPGVISVGAVTEHGCLAEYSNTGPDLDLVAPGGGEEDAERPDDPACRPKVLDGRPILQLAFTRDDKDFRYSRQYAGTSMAVPHVSATAALIIASGVLGPAPTAKAIENRLKATARDLGVSGPDSDYGYGLIDAGAATTP